MNSYYVDTSVMVAIAFSEPNASKYKQLLLSAEDVLSSYLLEAEFFSVIAREKAASEIISYLDNVSFVIPSRTLKEEYKKVFQNGYCRGSDAFHIACALYLDPDSNDLLFLTADEQQRKVALGVGFKAPKV